MLRSSADKVLRKLDSEIEETDEGIFLHFAFDYNRHDAIDMKVELPK